MKKNNIPPCCDTKVSNSHPDHTGEIHRINRAIGQLNGISRMITAGEYCPNIVTQIQATRAALKALEVIIIKQHINSCVRNAIQSNCTKQADIKLTELIELLKKL